MKTFIGLIALSATTSTAVGFYTENIFNALTLYTPLALISIVVKDTLDDRKLKRKYKKIMEEK